MDFDRVQAEWVLNRFPREQLPEVAAQAMMAGFEGPFIFDLVGYAAPSLDQLKLQTVEGAFREMGLPPLTKPQALLVLARRVASRILRNEVSCRAGAEAIQDLARSLDSEEMPDVMWEFRYLEDYEEQWSTAAVNFEKKVMQLAWTLLEES
jgi:hypothetical protein